VALWPVRRGYRAPWLEARGRRFAWGTRTYVMAIINVTPDSFSGDGTGGDLDQAEMLAQRFEAEGADLIDVGAESSRPGAPPLDAGEEAQRLLPSLRVIRNATSLPVSVDTYHAAVAELAIDAGADVVNDIHGLRGDPRMAEVVSRRGVPVIAMHNQRGRQTRDVIDDVRDGFASSLAIAEQHGIAPGQLIMDPGFGFGWTPEENLSMLRRLPEWWSMESPILLGTSRKSTLGLVLNAHPDERLEATAATVTAAIAGGADIVRVHDVREMVRVARMADAIYRGTWTSS